MQWEMSESRIDRSLVLVLVFDLSLCSLCFCCYCASDQIEVVGIHLGVSEVGDWNIQSILFR